MSLTETHMSAGCGCDQIHAAVWDQLGADFFCCRHLEPHHRATRYLFLRGQRASGADHSLRRVKPDGGLAILSELESRDAGLGKIYMSE